MAIIALLCSCAYFWTELAGLVYEKKRYKETPQWHIAKENVTFRTSLTGLASMLAIINNKVRCQLQSAAHNTINPKTTHDFPFTI